MRKIILKRKLKLFEFRNVRKSKGYKETAKMGLNMTLEQAQAQSASISSVCQAQVQGYQALQRAIQTFAEDTENLQGKAYDSARNYYQLVLLPLAQGGQLYAETLKKASADFPTSYEEKVDTKSWSEEQLQEYIRKEEMIAKFNDYAKSLARSSMPSELSINLKSITQNYCVGTI